MWDSGCWITKQAKPKAILWLDKWPRLTKLKVQSRCIISSPTHFKTIFGFHLSAFSKLPYLLLVGKSFINKNNSISRKMISKLLERSSLFQKEAVLVPFSTWFDFKSYMWNSLKTSLLSKGVTISLPKNKNVAFQSTKCFQTKDLWLDFLLKAFEFTLRAKSFSK